MRRRTAAGLYYATAGAIFLSFLLIAALCEQGPR